MGRLCHLHYLHDYDLELTADTIYTYRNDTCNGITHFVFPNNKVKATVMSYATGKNKKPLLLHGPNGTGKSKLSSLIPNAIEKSPVYTMSITPKPSSQQ